MAVQGFQIKAATKGLLKALRTLQTKVPPASKQSLSLWASHVIFKVIARNLGRPGLKVREGHLIRSFAHRESGSAQTKLRTVIFTRAKHAPIHEYGNPALRAKSASLLAIPIPGSPAALPSGASRWKSPLRSTLPGRGGAFRYFVKRAKGSKKLYLYRTDNTKGTGKTEALYRLKKSVRIRPRLKFLETARKEIKNLVRMQVRQYKKVIRGVKLN